MARYVVDKGKKTDTYKGIRISPDVYAVIRAQAYEERRTLLDMVQEMVRFYTEADDG